MCEMPNGRNLIIVDGEICAVNPGPNLVPATAEEIREFDQRRGFIPPKELVDNEIPV
ncbi:MAG: hypothetical protein US15_C0042G0011 [Candidatus Moranbacteria bacterium GW2011_GWF1_36_4]|nr:MAG: hypothetical protein US15_C0042G0011 [Candidatus Moranbacteria bacterium GW2011_GWF1_36_4]KKQ21887.1 MAG: hypothetical protein US37_C0006G0015 [Candidatus Moranbacteria bacterium GW2011_GWF2_37_11]KKQ29432.1 MAG: hypothetical protein US44_C0001G0024 [Candidatus Moranbacteria bacterium GW2011_GWD1_37_17]KKQ47000.1 MAG: hypothetical protein US66_C0022G0013 [Candidatus Moranbacteria bacterium GW2011_GWD2_37_9]